MIIFLVLVWIVTCVQKKLVEGHFIAAAILDYNTTKYMYVCMSLYCHLNYRWKKTIISIDRSTELW